MRYNARFIGCEKGAIGAHYEIVTTVDGDNRGDAKLRLYDRFEHIHQLTLTEIEPEPNYEEYVETADAQKARREA